MKELKINNDDCFCKIINPSEVHWAFIQPQNSNTGEYIIKFVDSKSNVFDEIKFPSWWSAKCDVKKNGFEYDFVYPHMGIEKPKKPKKPYCDKLGESPIYSSGKDWVFPANIEIDSEDYWVKAMGFEHVDLEWALITKQKNDKFKAFFIDECLYVIDTMVFDTIKEAEQGLSRNGFERFDSIKNNHEIKRQGYNERLYESIKEHPRAFSLPDKPFKKGKVSFTRPYSSGGEWE
jgi:hypothetical protein